MLITFVTTLLPCMLLFLGLSLRPDSSSVELLTLVPGGIPLESHFITLNSVLSID